MQSPEPFPVAPRTYWLWPRGSVIFSCVLALAMFGNDGWHILSGARGAHLSDFLFPTLYLLLCGTYAVISYRTFVRLTENSIEVCQLRGSRTLPFSKIKGRRRYTEKADPYSTPPRHLVVEPIDDRYPRLDIKEARELDESFFRWFDSLPALDKLDGIQEPKSKYENFSLI